LDAARRKFSPEFMNRIDKTVVFRVLGAPELRKILMIELRILQERIFHSAACVPFVFSLTESAKDHLLQQGTDEKYGARHLKRAIDQSMVHPLSNLIATRQVCGGDSIRVDYDRISGRVVFFKDAENLPLGAMAESMNIHVAPTAPTRPAGAAADPSGAIRARSSRR
jgi:ATP-dependent Clp protease ATP-binding subunit ClpA